MGRRRERKSSAPGIEPLDVDGVRTVAIVTVLWAVAFVALALQRAALTEAERGWWLWTCLAGVGLGLLGLEYCRKRRDAITEAELQREADAGLDEDEWGDDAPADGAAVADPTPTDERLEQLGPETYPPPEPFPAADPLPERPVHAEPAEQFGYSTVDGLPAVPQSDDQLRYPEGRPPPGYVTGEFPAVPRAEQAPPQHWPSAAEGPEPYQGTQEPAQPTFPYQAAAPAGYSPEPDFVRRHPRDIEMARRREDEPSDDIVGPAGSRSPLEFFEEEPDPASTTPDTAASDWLPPEADAASPQAAPQQEPTQPTEQPPADSDLVSEFFSDLPARDASPGRAEDPDDDPDVLLGDEPRSAGRRARRDPSADPSGATDEYRGRRARRD